MNISRNEPCPCGSGRKYKRCCMNMDEAVEKFDNALEEIVEDMPITKEEMLMNFLSGFQRFFLDSKPHMKEYKKIRKLHGEIIDSMMAYYEDGKFQLQVTKQNVDKGKQSNVVRLINSEFNTNTQVGSQGMANMVIYKNSSTTKCITDVFLEKNRFRKPEKIEFLKSMLDSKAGLFEVIKTEATEGYAYLKDVLTGNEFKITDIGLSGSLSFENFYSYMRIITYNGVSFGTGLNLIFKKEDPFIQNWIKENKQKYIEGEETLRFLELYNRYSKNDNGVKMKINNFY